MLHFLSFFSKFFTQSTTCINEKFSFFFLKPDKLQKLIKKESSENQVPTSRIAMLPKQRFKQEQRQMLLNADSIVNTYQQTTSNNNKTTTTNVKRNCSSQSTEEGFDEEFTSFSDENDELLILQNTQLDRVTTQVFQILFYFTFYLFLTYILSLKFQTTHTFQSIFATKTKSINKMKLEY